MQAYKRLQTHSSHDVEFGQKCHTPVIFEKTIQLPPRLSVVTSVGAESWVNASQVSPLELLSTAK